MGTTVFGLRLKELRVQAGLTQKELAVKAGMALGGLNKIEQGVNRPSWDTAIALAAALGVDCTAFTSEPANREAPGRGRPVKAADEKPAVKAGKGKRVASKREPRQ